MAMFKLVELDGNNIVRAYAANHDHIPNLGWMVVTDRIDVPNEDYMGREYFPGTDTFGPVPT